MDHPRPRPPTSSGGTGTRTEETTREPMGLQEAFTQLGRIVLDQQPLSQVLRQVADLAATCIPGADHVSVTLVEDGKARTAAFTGSAAAMMDERQYEKGFGPCLDAAESGSAVQVRDTSADEQYPAFSDLARRHGVRSSLSVGMPVPQRTVGALNLYRTSGPAFDEHAVELAQGFAGYAAVALANAALYANTTQLAEQMRQAMESRAVIEQAKGILVARTGTTPDEAFSQLSLSSQRQNRKLRDLAAEIVERASRRR